MRDDDTRPEFQDMPGTVDIPGRRLPGSDIGKISKAHGLWSGCRAILPVGSENAADVWWQPFIAVGPNVVWQGTPSRKPDDASSAALGELTSTMRLLFSSKGTLIMGTRIG